MNEKIIAALKLLDVANDAHWTTDGSPRLSALKIDGVTREQVAAVAPQFTRTNPVIDTPAVVAEKVEAVRAKEADTPENRRRELEAELKLAQKEVEDTAAAARKANDEYRKASAKVDEITRMISAYDESRAGQQDIMDYIAKSNARRMEAALEKKQNQAAMAEFLKKQKLGAL